MAIWFDSPVRIDGPDGAVAVGTAREAFEILSDTNWSPRGIERAQAIDGRRPDRPTRTRHSRSGTEDASSIPEWLFRDDCNFASGQAFVSEVSWHTTANRRFRASTRLDGNVRGRRRPRATMQQGENLAPHQPGARSDPEADPWGFTRVLRDLPVAVYVTDLAGVIVFFNAAAARLWGREPSAEDRWCGSLRLFTSEGEALAREHSPVARLLKGEPPTLWKHLVAERPDGSNLPFAAFPALLRQPDGTVYGAIATLLDRSEHERADTVSVRLAAIVESTSDAIISKNLNGILQSWNLAAEHLFGYSAEEAIGQPVTMLIPADRQDEEAVIIERIRRGESVKTYETIRQRKDGSLVPVSLTVSPVRDPNGRIVGASKIVRDISVRVEQRQRMRMLMRELNHRVKNQYAVILSMIRETRKQARDPLQFERQIRERVMALSASHDLLVADEWKGTTLFELLLTQIKPFGSEDRFVIAGPPIRIRPNAVQHLGIAFHELAANAAMHGALSQPIGSVKVSWEKGQAADGTEQIMLRWEETGAPVLTSPEHRGFGTVVLERIVPLSLNGRATLDMGIDGVKWALEAPIQSLLPDEGEAGLREY